MKRLLTAILLLVGIQSYAQVVINELMQSNIDCIMDDLNEFPDSWVELYNEGSSAVNLNQFKLGKTDKATEAWALPNQTLGAKQYILIYCDKEASGLHTDFRLESGKGCEVWLFKGDAVEDHVEELKKQPAPNIAYGRKTDGADKWGYQLTATPGASNCGTLAEGVLGTPVFSEEGGVFTSSKNMQLTLSLPAGVPESTEIRYTTNGTEPTANSTKYTSPICFSSTRTIRAKLFCSGWLSPRSTVHSYIFFPTTRTLTLPVISIVTDSKYLDDSKIGIYVDGSYQSGKKNYQFNWRRPINLEYFETAGQSAVLNQLCETRVMGAASRGNALKSLVIYANKRFGTKRFEHEFFPDQRPGTANFKSLQLRNAGNDFDYLYMRDAICQRTMGTHADLDWQAWRPAIVYINGTYKGILNIRERATEDNIYTNHDGLEDIDLIENWGELKEGTWDNYNQFKAFYSEHGHTMAEYEKWMDCKEFINLMVMNIYFNNMDFPGNNIVMWRPRAEGGRWRWVAKDLDYTMGIYNQFTATYKYIEWLYNPNYSSQFNWGANSSDATHLFRYLMEDEDFQREFIDHAAVYMGDFLNESGIWKVWEPMYNTIKTEWSFHRALYNAWWPNYNEELNTARDFIRSRSAQLYQQLSDYYNLGTPTTLVVNDQIQDTELSEANIRINGVRLTEGKFDGMFFAGRNITLNGESETGKTVSGWKVTCISSDGTTSTQQINGPSYQFVMPSCTKLVINATMADASGISNIESQNWTWSVSDGKLLLSNISTDSAVAIYDVWGTMVHQERACGEVQIFLPHKGVYILKVNNQSIKVINK